MTYYTRQAPFQNLGNLQREFDRMFNRFFGAGEDFCGQGFEGAWRPRADFGETKEAYVIKVELPGIPAEDIEINYQDGVLTVTGERKEEETSELKKIQVERFRGKFHRAFTIPEKVNSEGITATRKDGLLTIHIPKAEQSKPRNIEIS
jgi:HSP20 family protein